MQSGKYRHRVILLRRVDNQQPGGQVEFTYEPIAEVWARVAPLSGRELIAAQQVQSEVTTRINIRWRDDIPINETSRVHHITKNSESPPWYDAYDVNTALPDEKTGRRELVMTCIARTAEGWRG